MAIAPRAFGLLLAVMSLGGAVDAPAKIISLDERCLCAAPWRDHRQYVRCVKRNAYRYLRLETRFAVGAERRRIDRSELRAAARARVAEAVVSRCGEAEHLCDLRERPCPTGETCDVRGCERTTGVCVATPEACAADGTPRCTCGTDTDPFGRTYPNDCARLRAGARLDVFHNPPYTACEPSCGGPEALECPVPVQCLYPDGTCGQFAEHGRCVVSTSTAPDPVCGCDGTTYAARAEAEQAGARVAYAGPCGSYCGGPAGLACPAGLHCLKPWATCEHRDTWGACRAVTDATCLLLGVVCGCDGQLYGRPCDAVFAGTQVRGVPVDGTCPHP